MEASDQLHELAALPLGNEPLVPISQEAGCAPEPVWMQRKREKFLPLLEIKPQLSSL